MATAMSWPNGKNDLMLSHGVRWNTSVEPMRPSKRRVSSALPNHQRQATYPVVQERPATLPLLKRRIKSAPIGRPLRSGDGSDMVYSDVVRRRLNPLERVPATPAIGQANQQRRWNSGGWVTSVDDDDDSDDEWDDLLFEIDEESYWNKKLGKCLSISQIPLHLRTRADKLEWLKCQFRSPRTGGGGRTKQRPTTAQLERLLDAYENKQQPQGGDDESRSTGNRSRKKNTKGFDLEAVDEGDESDSDGELGNTKSGRWGFLSSASKTGDRGNTFGIGSSDADSDRTCAVCEGNATDGAETGGGGGGGGGDNKGNGIGTAGTPRGGPISGTLSLSGDKNGVTGNDSGGISSRWDDGRGAGFCLERNDGDMMREMLNRKRGELTNSRSSMASSLSSVSRRLRQNDITNIQQAYAFGGGTQLDDLAASTSASAVGNKTGRSGHRAGNGTDDNDKDQSGNAMSKKASGQLGANNDASSSKGKLSSSRIRWADLDGVKDLEGGDGGGQFSSRSEGLPANTSQVARGPPPHTRPEGFSFSFETDDGELPPDSRGAGRDGSRLLSRRKKLMQLPDLYSLRITRAFTYSYFTLPNQYREDKERFEKTAWPQGKKK